MTAVIDALCDKNRSDRCLATIYKYACLHEYQTELNLIIKDIETQHGAGTVVINDNVKRMLADDGINLLKNHDGTVQLNKKIVADLNLNRHSVIDSTLDGLLPKTLRTLIGTYDDDMEISCRNKDEILMILKSNDRSAKELLIGATSHQNKIAYLNEIFGVFKSKYGAVDLSRIDLSNLNLSRINLTFANLRFANLQNSNLSDSVLDFAILIGARLNNTNLSGAHCIGTNLTNARLIGADLSMARLCSAVLTDACLLCANLQEAVVGDSFSSDDAIYNFCHITAAQSSESKSELSLSKIQSPVNAVIVPTSLETISVAGSGTTGNTSAWRVVIDDNEKSILSANGIVIRNNADGSVQLSQDWITRSDPIRYQVIDSTLNMLPKALTELIRAYHDDIEVSAKNETAILDIFKSTDQVAKGQIIAAASSQLHIPYLNQLVQKLADQGTRLNLSHVDMSNLQLADIDLSSANLSHAIMHGCDLARASDSYQSDTRQSQWRQPGSRRFLLRKSDRYPSAWRQFDKSPFKRCDVGRRHVEVCKSDQCYFRPGRFNQCLAGSRKPAA